MQLSHSASFAPVSPAGARPGAPVRAALRQATHAIHLRMHGLAPFQAIVEARLPLAGYRSLLQSLLIYHSAIAGGAARCGGGASLGSGTRRRLALLRADLCALGAVPLEHSIDWQACNPEAALGALYTAAGSMLGGRVIAAQLDHLFGSASEGRSFFVGSTEDGADWRTLLSVLESRCAAPDLLEAAIGGALVGFDLFERCLLASGLSVGR